MVVSEMYFNRKLSRNEKKLKPDEKELKDVPSTKNQIKGRNLYKVIKCVYK